MISTTPTVWGPFATGKCLRIRLLAVILTSAPKSFISASLEFPLNLESTLIPRQVILLMWTASEWLGMAHPPHFMGEAQTSALFLSALNSVSMAVNFYFACVDLTQRKVTRFTLWRAQFSITSLRCEVSSYNNFETMWHVWTFYKPALKRLNKYWQTITLKIVLIF